MEKKKKKKRHPVTLVILIIALAVMIFSIVKLAGIQKDYKESEKTSQYIPLANKSFNLFTRLP